MSEQFKGLWAYVDRQISVIDIQFFIGFRTQFKIMQYMQLTFCQVDICSALSYGTRLF
jgi:hypothetical protein